MFRSPTARVTVELLRKGAGAEAMLELLREAVRPWRLSWVPETKPRPEQPDRSQTMSGPSAPRPVPKVSFTPGLLGRRGGRPTIRSIAVVWVSRKVDDVILFDAPRP